ncbi:MAG TPA: c-type cytochrome [Thermoanaerobaculia bacterium]
MTTRRRTPTLLLTLACLAVALYAFAGQQQTTGEQKPAAPSQAAPSQPQAKVPFDEAKALEDLKKQIAGRENEPAEAVFKNIQVLKGVPAGRIPLMMEKGFSDSLGVTCTFCHNPSDWTAAANHHHPISRQMWTMTQEINQRLLPAVQDLKNAQVNCTTCHRGQKKPALNLGPPPSQPQPQPGH